MKISNFLAHHALNELMLMGYTVVKGRLIQPEQLSQDACEYFGVAPLQLMRNDVEVKPALVEKINPYNLREAMNFAITNSVKDGVKITHLPSGISTEFNLSRSAHRNKDSAMRTLDERLDEEAENWEIQNT